jgi:hypothetical protein
MESEKDAGEPDPAQPEKQPWVKPEITSFLPVTAAKGIGYLPTDGISNLTP